MGFTLSRRVVNGLVPIRVHGGPRTGTVKEKIEPDPDPELFRNRFLGTGTRTIYETSLNPSPGVGRE